MIEIAGGVFLGVLALIVFFGFLADPVRSIYFVIAIAMVLAVVGGGLFLAIWLVSSNWEWLKQNVWWYLTPIILYGCYIDWRDKRRAKTESVDKPADAA